MYQTKSDISRHDWISLHTSLLEEERKTEVSTAQSQEKDLTLKELELRGVVLSKLNIKERSTGLYGRPMYTFISSRKDATLSTNSFSSGDIVGVHEYGASERKQLTSGVVTRVSQSSIQIVLDGDADELDSTADGALLYLHKLANNVTYQRIKTGLEELGKLTVGRSSHLTSVLFNEEAPKLISPRLPELLLQSNGDIMLFNERLDDSQQEAVSYAVRRNDLAIIHGPPGTGKTTTLIEIIRQHIKLKSKILACAPSNLAVDNLVERLAAVGVNVVRIGHPARVTSLTQKYTLDAILHNCEEAELLKDIHKDISEQLNKLKKTNEKGKRHYIRNEIKLFRKELRERETRLTKQILTTCDVILATLTSCGNDGPLRHLPQEHLDLIVIDECSQAIEASCYPSILRAPKVILAGDHCQLPPTILSQEAAAKGLALSLMERLIGLYGDTVVRMLTVQYRMNSLIMDWASAALYDDRLTAHPSVANHLLSQLKDVTTNDDTEHALMLIDTAGCDCYELNTPEEQSKGNRNEAIVVSCHVKNLLAAGVPETDIAVITPYNLQVELIRSLLRNHHPQVEVRSVDGFQGREKEAVVISLVRSNEEGKVGFLSENRRLNVAVTRARRHLCIVGDSETVTRHTFLKTLINYLCEHGIVRSAHEFQNDIDTVDVEMPESLILIRDKDLKKSKPDSTSDYKKVKQKKASKPPPPTEEENRKRKIEFEKIIKQFLDSPSQTHSFAANLNSYERRLIHEIAGSFGLKHESQGEGEERHIVIRKAGEGENQSEKLPSTKESSEDSKDEIEEEQQVYSLKREYEEIIDDFVGTHANTYKFPHSLSAHERQIVHAAAEERGLKHESIQEGKKRYVIIHNKNSPLLVPKNDERLNSSIDGSKVNTLKVDDSSDSQALFTGAIPKAGVISNNENVRPRSNVVTQTRFIDGKYQEVTISTESNVENKLPTKECRSCRRNILLQNYTVHSVHCEKQKAVRDEEIKNKTKKPEKKTKKKNKTTQSAEKEDFDTILENFTKVRKCTMRKLLTPHAVKDSALSTLKVWVGGFGRNVKSKQPYMLTEDMASLIYPNAKMSAAVAADLAAPIIAKIREETQALPEDLEGFGEEVLDEVAAINLDHEPMVVDNPGQGRELNEAGGMRAKVLSFSPSHSSSSSFQGFAGRPTTSRDKSGSVIPKVKPTKDTHRSIKKSLPKPSKPKPIRTSCTSTSSAPELMADLAKAAPPRQGLRARGSKPGSQDPGFDPATFSSMLMQEMGNLVQTKFQEISAQLVSSMEKTISTESNVENKLPTKECRSCRRNILLQNYTVHSVHCEKQKAVRDEEIKNKTKKPEKKTKKKNKTTQSAEKEDFDTILENFTKENNTCSQPKCKTPTTVIFQLCPFCRKTFCLSHHMAEIHGCGEQARKHARMMVSQEGVLYPGSGVPSKKPSGERRKQMQKKLEKKMDELESQRKSKKSSKDKS
ncbi:DNA-binding protein SMUBP-2-like [Macrobrachium nipponense]|uniref:DNA-binding protein SMUBP-2-like n=1 Tax=Macrobrachium nipponense TaxID=159736 RepID=UPI0030C7C16B